MLRLAGICVAAACCALLASAQDSSRIAIEQIGKGYVFTEGPAWSPGSFLIFSDTPADSLLKWIPGRGVEIFRKQANGPAGNAFDGQGRLYTCETHARRVTRTQRDGRMDVLAERWEGKRFNAPNGLAVSRSGHVYFTDPAFGGQADHRELDFYGVYHISPKGVLQLVAKPSGRPHGIALSPNGRILYVGNSDEHNVRAYDLGRGGEASRERVLIADTGGVPAGMCVAEDGDLYVAVGMGINIYSHEGHSIRRVAMHERPSNCAFQGDGAALYVTARESLYRIRFDVKGEK